MIRYVFALYGASLYLCIALPCMGQATKPGGESDPRGVPMLSVEETIDLATRVYIDGMPPQDRTRWERGNPAARPELYRILADPEKWQTWRLVAPTIGQIGTEDDLAKLLKVLRDLRGTSQGVRDMVWGVRNAVETLRKRGVPGAHEMVLEMCLPRFWSDMQFETAERRPPGYFTFANEEAYLTVMNTDESMGLTRREMLVRLLLEIPDRQQRKVIIEWASHADKQLNLDPQRWLGGASDLDHTATTQSAPEGGEAKRDNE